MLTVALTRTGKVYTMGSSVHGQLGNPQVKDKSIAIVDEKLKEEFVKEISTGSYHVAVLTSGGSVYTWGKGTNGQLGLGNVEDKNVPTLVEALRDRQNIAHPGGGSREQLSQQKALHDEKEERGRATPPGHRLRLTKQSSVESQPVERKTSRNQGEKQQHLETVSSISAGLPRWGQVSCPAIFESCDRNNSVHPLEPISSSSKHGQRASKCNVKLGARRFKKCQQTIEKTWLLAREEAAKRKAANEIIKALVLRIHSMSDKVSVRKGAEDGGGDPCQPQARPHHTDTPTVLASTHSPLQGGEKGLKRVRFSRKRFAEKEAGRWWEENQAMVYQHYGIEEYNKSNQNQERS
ncbi:F12P19.9 PROTEIN [Salix viminalis]|uniref:F12P19.9 PROTEIN n=1 Tax=Salix viminalis TaxID=40686 RepID=A0A9Q0TB52_SALVM|nr:F12P19.9 PROTEIN [Salix viminalis]